MTDVAKILTLNKVGSSLRTYRYWSRSGSVRFEGSTWVGDTLNTVGTIDYSLTETAKRVGVELITDDPTLINDLSWGSALSEGVIGYIYRDGLIWKRTPVRYRGLIESVEQDNMVVRFNLSTQDIDKDRIRPEIWSYQSQLYKYPNNQTCLLYTSPSPRDS